MSTSSQRPKLEQARKLLDQGDVAQAAGLLDDALRGDPKNAEAHFLLGVAHFKNSEWSTAERVFRDAIALRNRHVLAHYYLGLTLERQNRLEDAQLEYQFALRIQPNFKLAKEKLGIREASIEAVNLKEEPSTDLAALRQPIDATEQPVVGDRQQAETYKGDLVYSEKRRMRSFSATFLLSWVSLAAAVLFFYVSNTARGPDSQFFAKLFFMAASGFILLWVILYLKSLTTHYWIYERRIDFKSGVLRPLQHSLWIYEIDDMWLTRSLSNRLTGDATLHIRANISGRPQVSKLTGLGDHKFMNKLWEELRDAALVERRAMKRWWL